MEDGFGSETATKTGLGDLFTTSNGHWYCKGRKWSYFERSQLQYDDQVGVESAAKLISADQEGRSRP